MRNENFFFILSVSDVWLWIVKISTTVSFKLSYNMDIMFNVLEKCAARLVVDPN